MTARLSFISSNMEDAQIRQMGVDLIVETQARRAKLQCIYQKFIT